MKQKPQVFFATAVASCTLLTGCAGRLAVHPVPTLELDQGSLRMSLEVARDGSVNLAEHPPLRGRIDARPILEAESRTVHIVQIILHEGRYYVTAEGFRNLWELVLEPGTTRATYRPIPVPHGPLSGVRMSRYGQAGRACVRLDVDDGGPWFVNDDGELDDRCG